MSLLLSYELPSSCEGIIKPNSSSNKYRLPSNRPHWYAFITG